MKGDFIETMQFSFTPAKLMREQVSCPYLSKGLWRDLVNARELKARNVDDNFALLGFSHTMNQVKVATDDPHARSI